MAEFEHNGIKYIGKDIQVKGTELWIDGYCVADLKNPNTEEISVSGHGNITCDQTVIIYGSFKGNITAQKVIINGEAIGDVKADKIIDNR